MEGWFTEEELSRFLIWTIDGIESDNKLKLILIQKIFFTKQVDLFKKSDQLVGFKLVCWDRVVECHLDDGNNPIFKVRKLEEDDKPTILGEGFKNVGKQWTNDDVKQ